jgi:sugar phosphate permease
VSGILDGIGCLGGYFAGVMVSRLSVGWGWGGVFGLLASVAVALSVVAAVLWICERRRDAAPGRLLGHGG